jgi:hypothetical protein
VGPYLIFRHLAICEDSKEGTRASNPVETGAPSTIACPLSSAPAACAPSTRRSVAVCTPPAEDEKGTRYAMSAAASSRCISTRAVCRLAARRARLSNLGRGGATSEGGLGAFTYFFRCQILLLRG